MVSASLLACTAAVLTGLLLLRSWRAAQAGSAGATALHGLAGSAALLFLLIAPGGKNAAYAWALAGLAATIATGMVMFLIRERRQQFPARALWLHAAAAALALPLLLALR